MAKYYKLLNDAGTGGYSDYVWDVSGKWMHVDGPLKLHKNGFHALRLQDIPYWLLVGFNLYEIESGGDILDGGNKICCRSVRVIRKIKSYTRGSVLAEVISPAVDRAKAYADYAATADADAADYAARAAVGYAAAAAYFAAAYAASSARAARAAYFAAAYAAVAAREVAAAAAAAYWGSDDDDAEEKERALQANDIQKIIDRGN